MRALAALLVAALLSLTAQAQSSGRALRVCADPDNLPYSREDGSGFENRIAQLIAQDFGWQLQYAWLPDRRGFVRKTLGANLCDVIIGVPQGFERVLSTDAYYRSSYAVVVPEAVQERLASFDDPRLKQLRVGVQLIGNDLATSPPGYALARHGAIDNVVGYPVAGEQPAAQRMVRDVARGELDAAFVWGPQAGYFARQASVPVRVRLLDTPAGLTGQRFDFAIAMGVRRGDEGLRKRLNDFIHRRQSDIDRILDDYGVPRLPTRQP